MCALNLLIITDVQTWRPANRVHRKLFAITPRHSQSLPILPPNPQSTNTPSEACVPNHM